MSEEKKDFAEEVKDTANDFATGAKQALNSQDNKKILAGILAIFLEVWASTNLFLDTIKKGLFFCWLH